MPQNLIYHDLIEVPLYTSRPGIYWLRLYQGVGAHAIVVITEVPGNPSSWITDAISCVVEHVAERFSLDLATVEVYQIWPRRREGTSDNICPPEVQKVTLGEDPTWKPLKRSSIEAAVGASLAPLPEHDVLIQRVVALGGGTRQSIMQSVFAVMPVEDLPAPRNPYKCKHYQRFKQIRSEHPTLSATEVGGLFLASLTSADRAECQYHDAWWDQIADESVRILDRVGRADIECYQDEAKQVPLGAKESQWLCALFERPITVGETSYIDGQHRGCALRFSGAAWCAVAVGNEETDESSEEWTYLGDG